MRKQDLVIMCGTIVLSILLAEVPGKAMPPHPSLTERISNGEIDAPFALTHRSELLMRGVDSPSQVNRREKGLAKQASPMTTTNVLCIVVEFSDKAASVNAAEFDTLMFVNQQGSVRHYYNEVSYSNYDIITVNLPSALGWQTAPQTYAYYCNGANGLGTYPNNTQKLCEDLVDLVDPVVNFANYDNDGDTWVDGVVIVHTGPGAEFTGLGSDIWSHKWGITPRTKDGVKVFEYNIQPEYWSSAGDITLGVFAHELGHLLFGLPDLYDTDYSSNGLGKWSLMAGGSWNGSLGNSPAHPDAWSRIFCGFASSTNVVSNVTGQSIPSVEATSSGAIFRLWTNGGTGDQYFLVENRRKTGYDTYLPNDGLLIYHIDDAVISDNDNEWYPGHTAFGHYLVALEQSDNLYELDKDIDQGDTGDPFPGSTSKTSFTNLTTPSSDDYNSTNTLVGVSNISASASPMTADFTVSLAADVDELADDGVLPKEFSLHQNFPNPFNPSTRISFDLPKASQVEITVFNLLGEKVGVLVDRFLPAGVFGVDWSAENSEGKMLPSGVYFYRLKSDEGILTRKMILEK